MLYYSHGKEMAAFEFLMWLTEKFGKVHTHTIDFRKNQFPKYKREMEKIQEAYWEEQNETVREEIRLVAIHYPETSWGIQDYPVAKARLISREEEERNFTFCRVGPVRDKPNDRMIYGVFTWPENTTIEEWRELLFSLMIALHKQKLFRDDFTNQNWTHP